MPTVVDDMIVDIKANKILNPIVTRLFLRGKKSTFPLFLYHNLISKHLKLHDTSFHNENTQQNKSSTNSVESFIWHWVWRFHEDLQR